MTAPILTVVVPIIDPDVHLVRRCISSIRAIASFQEIEILIIDSSSNSQLSFFLEDLIVNYIHSFPPKGIYNAYNLGASIAKGDYIMFLGCDDILLPPLGKLVKSNTLTLGIYDVVVGAVLVESRGLIKPFCHYAGLIFANWPHQGIIYHRKIFNITKYNEKFKIQADHDLNIRISRAGYKIYFSDLTFSFFSSGGLSSISIDWPFRELMPRIVTENFGFFWGGICYVRRFIGDVKLFFGSAMGRRK